MLKTILQKTLRGSALCGLAALLCSVSLPVSAAPEKPAPQVQRAEEGQNPDFAAQRYAGSRPVQPPAAGGVQRSHTPPAVPSAESPAAAEKKAPAQPSARRSGMHRPDRPVHGHSERLRDASPDRHAAVPARGSSITMLQAVERAMRDNLSLASAAEQSKASEEDRYAKLGQFGPSVSLNYSASKREQYASPSRGSSMYPDSGTYSSSLTVKQPIFTGFRLLSEYQKSALQADSDRASLRQEELNKTGAVQIAFLNLLRAEENTVSEKEALDRLLDQLEITRAFYEVGLRPHLDVLQAEVDVSTAERVYVQSKNNRDIYRAELNVLLGLPATADVRYVGKLKHVPFTRKLEECLDAATAQRPDLFIASKSVEIARKNRKMAQSDFYPQVDAYYDTGKTGNTPDLQRSGSNGSESTYWEAGVKATWNVFQWGTTYHADQQAARLVSKVRYAEEELKLQVGYEIRSSLLKLREAEKLIAVGERSVAQATEAYNSALAQYQEQVGTNYDVLDASSKLLTAKASLTAAKADYMTALSKLYTAMGEYHPDLFRP